MCQSLQPYRTVEPDDLETLRNLSGKLQMPLLALFIPQKFCNGRDKVQPQSILFLVGGEMECRAYPKEKLQCDTERAVLLLLYDRRGEVFDGIDIVDHLSDPEDEVGIPEAADSFFEVGFHGKWEFAVLLRLLFELLFDEAFDIVVAYLADGILGLRPDKVRAVDEA